VTYRFKADSALMATRASLAVGTPVRVACGTIDEMGVVESAEVDTDESVYYVVRLRNGVRRAARGRYVTEVYE
jgi:hypothetical protein